MAIPEGYPTLFLSQSHRDFLTALSNADAESDTLGSIAGDIQYGQKTVNRLIAPLLSVGAIEAAGGSIGYAVTDVGASLIGMDSRREGEDV